MRPSSLKIGILILGLTLLGTSCNVSSLLGPDDKVIVSDIQAKLFLDSVLKTRDIHVASSGGVVTLSGAVNTDLEKSAAERLAGQESGVKKVDDQLTVTSDATAQAASAATPSAAEAAAPPEPAAATAPERPRTRKAERAPARAKVQANPTAVNDSAPSPSPSQTDAAAQNPSAPAQAAAPPPPPPPPPPVQVDIPAGTVITVRMIDGVDSSHDRAGQEFSASLASPIVVDNRVVAPSGSDARVRLVQAKQAGHMTGQSEVELELASVNIAGTNYDTQTTAYDQHGSSRGKRTAETVGGGAILGGLIGAIAGHGKGAAIGSVIGAGAGTAAEAGTHAPPVKVPPETKLDFTLKSPVNVTLPPGS